MQRTFLAAAIGLFWLISSVAPARAAIDPREIDAAIDSAKKFLYSQQKDGTWEKDFAPYHGDQATGQTALVVHALMSVGESHQDERIAKALDYLKKTPTTGIYALGVRCQLWAELPQTPDVKAAMARDAKLILAGIRKDGDGKGFYNYNPVGKAYSLSRAHYAVLGAWAAAESGYEVPNTYWSVIERAWINEQDPSGGWSYKGKSYTPKDKEKPYPVTPGMTADGIATLFITQDYLHADEAVSPRGNIKNPNIDKALEWMRANFKMVSEDKKFSRDNPYATLYAIERIGAASGLKYFGDIDWFALGAERLLRNQNKNGSWQGDYPSYEVSGTCFALLFLSRGRAPVVMNKLEYDVEGKAANWNQRPRDVANVTRWIGRQSEREVNWQSVNLKAPPADLNDAPILYIAGNQELKLTKDEIAKLRTFVEEGGMLLANADGAAPAFVTAFKKLGKELFPSYEFRQLPNEHPIFNAQFSAANWKRKVALQGLSNGVRELMLIAPDVDLSRAWQIQETKSKEELFQLAANIFFYSVDKRNALNKGETFQVALDTRVKPTRTIELARIKFLGNWDPEPGGWRRMAAILNNRDKVGLKVTTVDPGKDEMKSATFAHLTGVGKFKMTDGARASIKKFVEGGGTLIVDAGGGNGEFAQSAEAELNAMFGADASQLKDPLPQSHAIYNKIDDVSYRLFARQKLVGELKGPRVRGITLNGRLAVIYSPEDLSAGLVGKPVDGILGYSPGTATALMRNILLGTSAAPASAPATKSSTKPSK